MEFDYDLIIRHLKQCKKAALFEYLEHAIDLMDEAQLDDLFGHILVEKKIKPLKPEQVLAAMQAFRDDSLAGKYYAPFEINSKNFMHIPRETDEWFRDLSMWLDRACELVEGGHSDIARQCLDIGIDLVDRMENGEEIIFADEYGDWMVNTEYDYRAVHQQLLKKK